MNENTDEKFICIGRQNEQRDLEQYIMDYTIGTSYVVNLYGRGGIGKTVLTKALYRNCDKMNNRGNQQKMKAVYINASGCFDIPELLFRLRMELENGKYDFEKFDTLYELFYDASRFIQYKNTKKLEEKAVLGDDTSRNYIITAEMAEHSSKLSELLLEPLIKAFSSNLHDIDKVGFPQFLIKSAEIAGPIVDRISIVGLISRIVQVVKNHEKCRHYIDLLKEIQSSQGIFPQEEKLISFFKNALLNNENKKTNEFLLIFIDNFQNPDSATIHNGGFVFQNADMFFNMIHEFSALWFISSRNHLPEGTADAFYPLKGLRYEAARKIIKSVKGIESLNNEEAVAESILSVASDGTASAENVRYSPIILNILCQVLKKEIENVQSRAPGATEYNISPELFAKIENQPALTYYFEMGKSPVDLDCFHILSCADIWNEYTLSVLRGKIQLYLLNTKHILAQDSMIEVVGNHSIKLHDEITEALRKSVNNRIRYDVYSIMYEAFLEIQDVAPVIDEGILRSFFGFTKAYCQNILDGVYNYLSIDVLEIYTAYYNAFLKSIEKVNERISESLIEIYWAVVKEYREVAENCKTDDFSSVFDAYHNLGIVVYNCGDSKKAEIIDKEYLDLVEEKKDIYGLASALNALAYDLSANHLYQESYVYGKRSLDVALEGIHSIAEQKGNKLAKNFYALYKGYLMLPEGDLEYTGYYENIEDIITANTLLLEQIRNIPQDSEAYMMKNLWEQMLKTRGNIPWYFIEDVSTRHKNAQYALYYGEITYLLRKCYYGEDDPRTVQSYHNKGAYLLKYAEYCLKGEIVDKGINLEKAFFSAEEIFSNAFQKRKQILRNHQRIDKDNYLQELEETSIDVEPHFLEIFSLEDIEQCYKEKLSECNPVALESLQYQSNACYFLSTVQKGEREKKKYLKKAISLSDKVIIARSIVLGPCHRKTLESFRYGAEYYWEYGEYNEARKRIQYASRHLNNAHISNDKIEEYKDVLKRMTGEKE